KGRATAYNFAIDQWIRRYLRTGRAGYLAFIALLAFGASAKAQLDTGSISGVIEDPAGRVVAGATVTAVSNATGTRYSTVSSNTGYYVFPSARTGAYELSVNAAGFKTEVYNGVVVAVGVTTSRDVTLSV